MKRRRLYLTCHCYCYWIIAPAMQTGAYASATTGAVPKKRNMFENLKKEHPLRMNRWNISITPYAGHSHLFNGDDQQQVMVFDSDARRVEWIYPGTGERNNSTSGQDNDVSSSAHNSTLTQTIHQANTIDASTPTYHPPILEHVRKKRMGRWKLQHGCVTWHLPLRRDESSNDYRAHDTILHYHAYIHLQKFDSKPRMYRGVITRDRYKSKKGGLMIPKDWFRPVVATFQGIGQGEDTVDINYRGRYHSIEAAAREAERERQSKQSNDSKENRCKETKHFRPVRYD